MDCTCSKINKFGLVVQKHGFMLFRNMVLCCSSSTHQPTTLSIFEVDFLGGTIRNYGIRFYLEREGWRTVHTEPQVTT